MRVSLRTGGDVGVNHGFEIVPGVGEGTPDDISAGATVGRRIPALVIAGIVRRHRFGVLARPTHDIRVIVYAVTVRVDLAGECR